MRRRRKGADVDKPYGFAKRGIARWIRNNLKLSLRRQVADYQSGDKNEDDADVQQKSATESVRPI